MPDQVPLLEDTRWLITTFLAVWGAVLSTYHFVSLHRLFVTRPGTEAHSRDVDHEYTQPRSFGPSSQVKSAFPYLPVTFWSRAPGATIYHNPVRAPQ